MLLIFDLKGILAILPFLLAGIVSRYRTTRNLVHEYGKSMFTNALCFHVTVESSVSTFIAVQSRELMPVHPSCPAIYAEPSTLCVRYGITIITTGAMLGRYISGRLATMTLPGLNLIG